MAEGGGAAGKEGGVCKRGCLTERGRGGGIRWGAPNSFVACLRHLIIHHAPLLRRSTVLTPNRDIPVFIALHFFFGLIASLFSCFAFWGRGCTHVTHSRTDPCIPTMPGRSASGFHRQGRRRVHQARSAVRCSASRTKGELHPTKIHL